MQRVALFSTGIRSDISTDLAIAEQLRAVGLATTICAHRAGDEKRIRANDVDFMHYERHDVGAIESVLARLQEGRSGNDAPDLYLCHAELHREQLVCLARNLPVVAIDSHVSVDRRRGVPPLTATQQPGGFDRWTADWRWRRLLNQRRSRPAFLRQIDFLQQFTQSLNLDFDAISTFDHWHPVRFKPIPYWCLAAPEFDFAGARPPTTPHLGPLVASHLIEPAAADAEFSRLQPWLDNADSLVYCSFGSLLSDQRLLLEVVRAARLRPNVSWLLGTNGLSAIPDLGVVPDNVRVLADVPQRAVLASCSAMITGAGIATINECINARVPMIVYSLGVLDQNGNAARVAWHGLGRRGHRADDGASDILKRLDSVLAGQCASSLDKMADCFADYGQQKKLANNVVERING